MALTRPVVPTPDTDGTDVMPMTRRLPRAPLAPSMDDIRMLWKRREQILCAREVSP